MMVGQWTKPSRSDEVLDADQQLKMANQIRAHFDSMAPMRPSKPNRSEPDPITSSSILENHTHIIPHELHKLQSLQSQPHAVLFSGEGAATVADEFLETQYYRELDSIDKQHHTTGSGFIKVVEDEISTDHDDIQLREDRFGAVRTVPPVLRSNPATNDWVPNVDEDQIFISSKPNRSESSY